MAVQEATNPVGSLGVKLSMRSRSVFVAIVGNMLEWFDFTIYGIVASILARQFFSARTETISLLLGFATFGLAFLARPLGAVLFGRLADIKGRKYVLMLSMLLMAGASVLIGVCPTFHAIGIFAPALIIIARLIQGLSAGAEFGGAAAFLVESAPGLRRGFVSSFHQVGGFGGLLLGSVTVALLGSMLTPAQLDDWGWRIPFLLGSLAGVVALYMRRNVEESPYFRNLSHEPHFVSEASPQTFKLVAQCIGMMALWAAATFGVVVYLNSFTQRVGGLTREQALWSTTITTLITVLAIPVAGALSDRIGRRPVMGLGAVAFIVLPVPLYTVIVGHPGFVVILLIQSVLAICTALSVGAGPAAISELFNTRRRATLVGIASAIAAAVFGGFGPFISTVLTEQTGSQVAPAYYLVGAAILTGLTLLTIRETAFEKLR